MPKTDTSTGSNHFEKIQQILSFKNKKDEDMGKGDKKSKRGKIANKSYGVRRPRKIKKKTSVEDKVGVKSKT